MIYLLIGAALLFDFLNGFNDSSSLVATAIASQAMSPRRALVLTAVAEFLGPLVFGSAVANAVGKGLISPQAVSVQAVLAASAAAILWNRVTWFLALPSSSSHALVGGLMGAALMAAGPDAIQLGGLIKVLAALFLAPPLGFLAGFGFMRLTLAMASSATPGISDWFRRGQVFTSVGLALSHGANDSQKTMGIITMGLLAAGQIKSFAVPPWVLLVSAAGLSAGTLSGGYRLIRTLGGRIFTIRPVHGFTAHVASSLVVISAALAGGPVSATQVIGSSIMGVGAAERVSKVRWQVARDMLTAWGLTIPATLAAGALIYYLIRNWNF